MEKIETPLKGLVEILYDVYEDHRGHFFEAFQESKFKSIGIPHIFVQDNESFSKKGVLRGLHLQKEPYSQAKLVRVITGSIMDVVVDLRPDSQTFGQHYKCMLNQDTPKMLYVPEGFAHGFIAYEDTIFHYKCSAPYNKSAETGIMWNDPELGIDWDTEKPLISQKDLELPTLSQYKAAL